MLSAYADEHVHAAIVNGLRLRGMDVVTVQERGQGAVDDDILLATATAEGRMMLTNDKDFLRIHSAWMAAGKSHAGIGFLRSGLSIGEAIRRTLRYASQTAPADAANVLRFL
jgi:predicted nuclease of predicted toxin-antitoxin system